MEQNPDSAAAILEQILLELYDDPYTIEDCSSQLKRLRVHPQDLQLLLLMRNKRKPVTLEKFAELTKKRIWNVRRNVNRLRSKGLIDLHVIPAKSPNEYGKMVDDCGYKISKKGKFVLKGKIRPASERINAGNKTTLQRKLGGKLIDMVKNENGLEYTINRDINGNLSVTYERGDVITGEYARKIKLITETCGLIAPHQRIRNYSFNSATFLWSVLSLDTIYLKSVSPHRYDFFLGKYEIDPLYNGLIISRDNAINQLDYNRYQILFSPMKTNWPSGRRNFENIVYESSKSLWVEIPCANVEKDQMDGCPTHLRIAVDTISRFTGLGIIPFAVTSTMDNICLYFRLHSPLRDIKRIEKCLKRLSYFCGGNGSTVTHRDLLRIPKVRYKTRNRYDKTNCNIIFLSYCIESYTISRFENLLGIHG